MPAAMRARGTRQQPITTRDPRWGTTFPEIVAPRTDDDESLVGLLLRSDFANDWPPGTSLQLSSPGPWRQYMRALLWCYNVEFTALTNALALTPSDVGATTYVRELTTLYLGTTTKHWIDLLGYPAPFQICPRCLAEDHLLRRTHLLPGLSHCLEHNVKLCTQCICGLWLEAFQASPFPRRPRSPTTLYACRRCGLPWESLPCEVGETEALSQDRHLFSWYQTFLGHPVPELLKRALALLNHEPSGQQTNTDGWARFARRGFVKYHARWSPIAYHPLDSICESLVRDGFFPHCVARDNFATCCKRYVIADVTQRRITVNVPTSRLDEPCPCGDPTWRDSLEQLFDRLGQPTHVLYQW